MDPIIDAAGLTDNNNGFVTPGAQTLGQTDFLRLLVAQLNNQDPMNPVESTEFVTQLAQFSSLEQLISIRQATETLLQLEYELGLQNSPAPPVDPDDLPNNLLRKLLT